MAPRCSWILAFALCTTVPAMATDHPLSGRRLAVRRTKIGTRLSLTSTDGSAIFPTTGSSGDLAETGVSIDVITGGEGAMSAVIPPAASGWTHTTRSYRFTNTTAPAGVSTVRAFRLRKDKGLTLDLRALGLPLTAPLGGSVAVRIAYGSERVCMLFGGASVRKDTAGRFLAVDASSAGIASCGASDLGGRAICGNDDVEVDEQCDPPGQQGQCAQGQFCGVDCQCAAQIACDCGAQTPTKLKFTTAVNPLTCGTVTDGQNATLLSLPCGTRWFGGGVVAVSLPQAEPDLGVSFENVTGCSGTFLGLGNTTSTDTGSNRTCTTAGCTFGAPLPAPNEAVSVVSVCIVNKVSKSAKGYADCATGSINLNLPLESRLYVGGGDLLPDDFQKPYTLGIQPCPICVDDGGLRCKGGPNDGQACTPETSALGDGYPTSQDCPPDSNLYIGSLTMPFALTTGTSTKTGVALGSQTNAFCGFCRDPQSTAFEGTPMNQGDPPGTPRMCQSDVDCTVPPFTSCQQKEGGAFNYPTAHTVTETGTPAGDLRDGMGHDATLASVFCLPPSFSPLVDPAAGLPGPGTTSLPGAAQLVP